jgi:truncated hemoglobin YjbI
MSKLELRRATEQLCGVSHDEAHNVLVNKQGQGRFLDRIGSEEGCRQLSQLFYDRVFADKGNPWFLQIFASSTKSEAIDNQYRFLVQLLGGPALYQQKKGKYTRLVGRHANYGVHLKAALRWTEHMRLAIEDHTFLKHDEEAKDMLHKYFIYTAHYIVIASEYMRPDQLSGGTNVDTGRIW